MALRARKPEAVQKRLKLFMFGPAGVGKTTAAIQFPNSYIIDCERGTENYDKIIARSNSVVYQTVDVHEVTAEVKRNSRKFCEFNDRKPTGSAGGPHGPGASGNPHLKWAGCRADAVWKDSCLFAKGGTGYGPDGHAAR